TARRSIWCETIHRTRDRVIGLARSQASCRNLKYNLVYPSTSKPVFELSEGTGYCVRGAGEAILVHHLRGNEVAQFIPARPESLKGRNDVQLVLLPSCARKVSGVALGGKVQSKRAPRALNGARPP